VSNSRILGSLAVTLEAEPAKKALIRIRDRLTSNNFFIVHSSDLFD
jgi:hypothetical protein